jgi:integral membrane sensor domain MASE1
MVEERRRGHFIFAAFASSLFANLIFDNDVLISLALSFLNSAEATFLYLWFTAVYRGPMRFDRPERVFAYAGMAALVALVSAGLAALVLQPVGEQPMRVARAWFGGDFLAYLVVTPLVLILGAIFRQESFARLERSTQELAVHAIALIAIPFSSSSSPRSRCYSCALPRRCFLSADWGWRALRCRW